VGFAQPKRDELIHLAPVRFSDRYGVRSRSRGENGGLVAK
jgi:hypothetical protein